MLPDAFLPISTDFVEMKSGGLYLPTSSGSARAMSREMRSMLH